MSKQAQHICLNCRLPIEGEEEQVPVEELREIRQRKVKARIRPRGSDTSPVRYRHKTLEDCTKAEHKAAQL